MATEGGIGRLDDVDGKPKYRLITDLPGVTALAPAAGPRIWAGSVAGLYAIDGGGGALVPGASRPITSLDLDSDGHSVWAGVQGMGLVHVDGRAVVATFGPSAADKLDFVDALGVASLPNGTRVAAGRGADGSARILLLRTEGAELLDAQPDVPLVALVQGPAGPLLLAGAEGRAALYTLSPVQRGEVVLRGFKLSPVHKSLNGMRLAARPDGRTSPPDVTVVAAGGGNVFVGTRRTGTVQLTTGAPQYLPSGELTVDARGLSVVCPEAKRCFIATGAGPGWSWDGTKGVGEVRPLPPNVLGGNLMALAGDGSAGVYAIAGDAGKALRVSKLDADGLRWMPFTSIARAASSPRSPTCRRSATSGSRFAIAWPADRSWGAG